MYFISAEHQPKTKKKYKQIEIEHNEMYECVWYMYMNGNTYIDFPTQATHLFIKFTICNWYFFPYMQCKHMQCIMELLLLPQNRKRHFTSPPLSTTHFEANCQQIASFTRSMIWSNWLEMQILFAFIVKMAICFFFYFDWSYCSHETGNIDIVSMQRWINLNLWLLVYLVFSFGK